MSDYFEKLKDPRWQKRRLKVLEGADWKCGACGDTSETLHVHHLVYNGHDPWDSEDGDLESLCERCHEFREAFNRFGKEFGMKRTRMPTKVCLMMMEIMFDDRVPPNVALDKVAHHIERMMGALQRFDYKNKMAYFRFLNGGKKFKVRE